MERKYTMRKTLAAAIIYRIHEENLPIEVHEGNEQVDCHGDKQVDILLVYDNPDLVNNVISDTINEYMFNYV